MAPDLFGGMVTGRSFGMPDRDTYAVFAMNL